MAKQPSTQSTHSTADARADEDAQAFRAAVRDVTPLPNSELARGLDEQRPRTRRRTSSAAATGEYAERMPLIDAPVGASSPADAGAAALSFRRSGVRSQVMRRLRRGQYPVEDELDLHGLSQSEARDNLAHFLELSRNAGRRCVRIIHGKGYRSGARGPILKIAVDSWLRHHSLVMAFTSARDIDGGTGAVYVLLRA